MNGSLRQRQFKDLIISVNHQKVWMWFFEITVEPCAGEAQTAHWLAKGRLQGII